MRPSHNQARRPIRNDSAPHDDWPAAILAVHADILLALVGLALSCPNASDWISQAAEAEFGGAEQASQPQLAPPEQQRLVTRQ